MAIRKHQAPAADAKAAADPSQEAQPAGAGVAAIPAAAGGLSASEQAYGDQAQTGGQGEMQQLQMQMHIDRKQKADQTMSNVAHKQAETADNITDNIK